MNRKDAFLEQALNERKENHQLRELTSFAGPDDAGVVIYEGERVIDFCSNDYLGLSNHPSVKEKSKKYLQQYGTGSRASRLISGTLDIHMRLEEKIAAALGCESALIFNSGFQANSSILGTVTDRHSLILADKLSHKSLLQGSLASRATFQRFDHNNTDHLELLLKKAAQQNYNRIWIVTETIFSMDGDRSPVAEIASLARRYNALFFVDDAHAVGVWGEDGLGLSQDISEVDLLLGTCGKAFGSFGAYVACSHKMKNYLINFCPGFIYTTALPPAVIGATEAALQLIPTLNRERKEYHANIRFFREQVQELGFDTGLSSTQIIPIIIGNEQQTLKLAEYLRERNFLATAIRPPTVPEKSSRIRITLSAVHSTEQIERLISALKKFRHG